MARRMISFCWVVIRWLRCGLWRGLVVRGLGCGCGMCLRRRRLGLLRGVWRLSRLLLLMMLVGESRLVVVLFLGCGPSGCRRRWRSVGCGPLRVWRVRRLRITFRWFLGCVVLLMWLLCRRRCGMLLSGRKCCVRS